MPVDDKTRPTGEQLRFRSAATGDHVLDEYLEASEKGGRTLPDLLSDIFDSSGVYATNNFQFRINATTRAYQVRIGLFTDPNAGWLNIPNGFVFRQRGTFANATAYEQLDVVTISNTTYVCTLAHTSSTSTPDPTKFSVIVDGTALNTATSSAQTSATNAATSATNAQTSATAAAASQSAAATSATNAATSASSASTSASTATTKAGEAASSASAALTSANNAAASQASATASQSAAAASASSASASQTSASNSASAAATSASNASSSATSAANSAATATTKSNDSAASAILANDWATKTSGPVAGGEFSAKYNASQAASSASAAATSASNASTSAASALAAKNAAETARDQTLDAFDSFDDRYLGTKTSDPTVDNDGNALVAGALYFNSTAGVMKVYTGTTWVAAYVSGTNFLALSGGTLTGPLNLYGNATANLEAIPKQQLDTGLATKANTVHTHTSTDITDSTSAGRSLLTAASASAQRTSLGLGTAATQDTTAFAAASHTHPASQISDSTTAGRALITAADAAAQRTALGLGTAATTNSTAYAAATHSHPISDVTGLQTALDGKQAAGSYAAAVHVHAISDITNLQTSLDAKLAITATTYVQQTSASGAAQIPSGDDAARPGTPTAGMVRFNTTSQSLEIYTTSWGSVGGGMSTGKVYFFSSF